MKHARNFLPQDTLKHSAKVLLNRIFVRVPYGGSCWGKTELDQFQKLPNRAAIIVRNSSYDAPSKPLLHKPEWNSIQELIADETKMMVFKSINDFGPKYRYKMFIRNSHLTEGILRNTTSFSYRGAKVWNSLSTECKEARTVRVFKSF